MNKFKSLILLTTLMFSTTAMNAFTCIVVNDTNKDLQVGYELKFGGYGSYGKAVEEKMVKAGEIIDLSSDSLPNDKGIYYFPESKSSKSQKITLPTNLEDTDTLIVRINPKDATTRISDAKAKIIKELKKSIENLRGLTKVFNLKTSDFEPKKYKNKKEIDKALEKLEEFNEAYGKILDGKVEFDYTEKYLKEQKKDL